MATRQDGRPGPPLTGEGGRRPGGVCRSGPEPRPHPLASQEKGSQRRGGRDVSFRSSCATASRAATCACERHPRHPCLLVRRSVAPRSGAARRAISAGRRARATAVSRRRSRPRMPRRSTRLARSRQTTGAANQRAPVACYVEAIARGSFIAIVRGRMCLRQAFPHHPPLAIVAWRWVLAPFRMISARRVYHF